MKLIEQIILIPYAPGFLIISHLPKAPVKETVDKSADIKRTKRYAVCLQDFKLQLNEHLN